MPHRAIPPTWSVRCLIVLAIFAVCASRAEADDAGVELYEKKVRPALVEHCVKCHGPEKQEGGLQVDSVAAMLRGGDQGPAVMPGDPDASLLIQGVRYDDINFQMPPKGKMPAETVAALEEWVRMGAAAPASEQRTPAAAVKKFDLAERAKHWCFQPIKKTTPPEVGNRAWPRGDVDRFILQKLEAAKLRPAEEAEPQELIRRLSFDLIGLPPTAAEVDSFVAEYQAANDDAGRERVYGVLVDRLLASPHFGERWARHWLDLVRYAESRGHEFDYVIPNAFQYRDYVIRALNADVPYDRFVVEHLAGDLIPEPRRHPQTGGNESILGTGFWFLGEECHSPVDIRQDETDRIDNKIDVMSKAFLGLTLACARCHDHKFDALSTKDYYAMSGFVLGMSYRQAAFEALEHNRRIYDAVKGLENKNRRVLLEEHARLLRPGLAKLERYLDAARSTAISDVPEGRAATIDKAGLDEVVINKWVAEFRTARDDRRHPLHAWIRRDVDKSDVLAGVPPLTPAAPPRVLIDFATLKPADWLADGIAFGDGPVHPGDLQIGADAQRPIERLFTYSGAVARAKWDVFRASESAEGEPGRMNWQQAGRTIKTPTFTLGSGKLWYLVRGSASVYASVASHRMNNGPLHGNLIRRIDGPDTFRWVHHDLGGYTNARVHLEFTPIFPGEAKEGKSAACEVLLIVEADREPQLADFVPAASVPASDSPADLANRFRDALDSMAADRLDASLPGLSATAAWMLERRDLFARTSGEKTVVGPQAAEFFRRQSELLAQLKKSSPTAPAAWEGSAVDEYVLVRGNHRTVGELVPRRFLEAIDGESADSYRTTGGRLALAERLVDRSDPLPARVMVNRLWQHLFGAGLVRTVDNFGSMGELPTHPELLDHLAQEFMDDGWSVKRMLRELATSRTYRMSSLATKRSAADADPAVADPENKLLHRARVKRLEAEIVRDAMLAVSGRLDDKLFGPSVGVYITLFMDGRGKPQSGPLDGQGRRSIYLQVRRNFLNPMFQAFDYPTPFTSVGRRSVSNVPQQALALMNGPLPVELAKKWAQSTLNDSKQSSTDVRISRLYSEAFARKPSADELAAGREFLAEQQKQYASTSPDDPRAWADYCQVLMNTKEFIFIP